MREASPLCFCLPSLRILLGSSVSLASTGLRASGDGLLRRLAEQCRMGVVSLSEPGTGKIEHDDECEDE